MTRIDDDWRLINGYADGELTEAARAALDRRLASEPALAEALAEVRRVKAGMSLLAPRPAAARPYAAASGWRRPGRWIALAAAAASVAAIVLVGPGRDPVETADGAGLGGAVAAIHAELSANAYVLGPGGAVGTISTGRMGDIAAFDLSASRLALVDVRAVRDAGRDIVAMHYRGRNGCRLTIAATASLAEAPLAAPAGAGELTAQWSAGGIDFQILATGMDRDRFDAIAAYARGESLQREADDALRVALLSATDQARPCA